MKYPKLPVERSDEALHDFAERYMVLKVAQMRKHWKDTFEDFLRGGNIDSSTREAVIMRQAWNSALDMAADSLDCIADRKSFFMDGEVSYSCTSESPIGFGRVKQVCIATHLATGKQVRAVNVLSTHRSMVQARQELESLVLNLPAQPLTQKEVQPQKDDLHAKVEQLGMRVVELTETIKRTKEGKDDAVAFLEEVNKQRNDLLELVKVQTTLLQGLQLTQASIFPAEPTVSLTVLPFNEDAERAQFEKTMRHECDMERKVAGPHDGTYTYRPTHLAWEAWKARAKSTSAANL